MSDALTAPFEVAAVVVTIAGLAKLRAPATATRALADVGLPAGRALVRLFAASEVVLGAWCLMSPGPLNAGLLAGVYACFTATTLVLARRRVTCGCFGELDVPASVTQSILSLALALVAVAAVVRTPHGVAWLVERPVPSAAILLLGIAAGAYGTVVAYLELPQAWYSWSSR